MNNCYQMICFRWRIVINIMLVLLTGVVFCQAVNAETKELEYYGKAFQFPVGTLERDLDFPEKTPPWIVEIKDARQWIPRYIQSTDNNQFCMVIQYAVPEGRPPDAAFTLVDENTYQPGYHRGGGQDATCVERGADVVLPTFKVFIRIDPALRDTLMYENGYVTRILLDIDTSEFTRKVSSYKWILQARSPVGEWMNIGGLNSGDFSQSRWIQDPADANHYALVLVGEAPGGGSASEPDERFIQSRSSPSVFSLRGFQSAVDSRKKQGDAAPVISFRNGQSVKNLILEVIATASNPGSGLFCIRPVYHEKSRYLGFGNNAGKWQTAGALKIAEFDSASCSSNDTLVFPVFLQLDPAAIKHDIARFYISQSASGATLDLGRNAVVTLKSGDTGRGTTLAAYESSGGNSASGWVSVRGKPALFLSTSQRAQRQVARNAANLVSLRYSGYGEPPDDALMADGVIWQNWIESKELAGEIELQWQADKAVPLSIQLCRNDDCEEGGLIATLDNTQTSVTLSADQFQGEEKAYVVINWAPGATAGTAASASATASGAATTQRSSASIGSAITFAPVVSYGNYSRPLTACIGKIVSESNAGSLFSLKLGKQVLEPDAWPDSLAPDDTVKIVFDQARGGGSCPVAGLESRLFVVSNLLELASYGPIELTIAVKEPLFVGYFQLNGADYRSTLVRWREVIELFSRTYVHGKESGHWVDGLVFSAGEKGGVYPTIEPDSNFVSKLADDTSLLNIAQSLESTTRVSSDVFAEQLSSLHDLVGSTPVSVMYFDDFLSHCGSYAADLSASGLNVKEAIVVAAIDGYTGREDSIKALGGGVAHICEKKDNPDITVYAFNWKEQLGNLAWEKTFNTIYDDLVQ